MLTGLNFCKACKRKEAKRNRDSNLEHYQAYDRERNKVRNSYDKTLKGRLKYPEKYKARSAVSNAVRDGRLIKLPCEVCGNENTHGHHDDYSKPLDVIWLCSFHHGERHRQINMEIQ